MVGDPPVLCETEYQQLFECIHDAVVVFDPVDEKVLAVNRHACRIYRRERENFVGTSIREFSRDVEWGTEQIRRTMEATGHCHFTTTQYRGDGSEMLLDVSAAAVDLAGHPAIISVNRDVTDRANLMRRLGQTAAEWQMTVDSIDAAILLVDARGRIFRANRYARSLRGDSFVDRNLGDLGENEPWQTMRTLARTALDRHSHMLAQVLDAGSPQRAWQVVVEPPQSADGSGCLVVIATDVSSIVQLEHSLRQNEAVAELGRLVGGVAHEVRNPLFVISATCDAIESRWQPSEDIARQHLKNLRAEINRVADMMGDLLVHGKPGTLHLALEPIRDVVSAAVRDAGRLAADKGVSIAVDVADDSGAVDVDHASFVVAVRNLIENAIHHSPPGESVFVRVFAQPSGQIVCIHVEDRGRGFEPSDLGSVFEPFFSKRRGGTGLGLSLARRAVEMHGGQITAENRAGGGARFVVELARVTG